MKTTTTNRRRGAARGAFIALLMGGTALQILPSCESVLTTFDPCGTILGNCTPGTFELLFADVPDWDVDPTCTIPGACGTAADAPGTFVDPFEQLGPGAGP